DYIKHVLDYGDDTTLPQLIDDYLDYNPSRNRALDMTVLWKHFCPQHLKKRTYDDSMTRARPTFHYRLPNCEIEKTDWYLSISWNIWCVVEYIAAHDDIIATLTAKRQQSHSKSLFKTDKTWNDEFEKIADGLLSE
ncbi:MAG TPA: amidoligase family protein, partial [Desulfopila sp.]|nr:amidoligase family protein [Desulfopila sp.]